MIQEMDEHHTVRAAMEQIVVVWVDGQTLLQKFVIFADTANCARNHTDFFKQVSVLTTTLRLHGVCCTSFGSQGGSKGLVST